MAEIILKRAKPKKYYNKDAISKTIHYIYRKDRRGNTNIYGSFGAFGTDTDSIIGDFMKLKKLHHKSDGLQLVHYILSFPTDFVEPPKNRFRELIIRTAKIWGKDFQVAYALHEKTDNLHVHFIINATSYSGKKISITNKRFYKYKKLACRIWKEYETENRNDL